MSANNSNSNNIINNETDSSPKKPEKSVESKLGDLMMQGWTMLADSCFSDSCSTPLMRDNVTKQIYCVGCEAWVVNKDRKKEKVKFNEIVSVHNRKNLLNNKNNNEITKIEKNHSEITKIEKNKDFPSFREILETKLIEMSEWLRTERCPEKCNSILDGMKKIMELLKGVQINN